MENDTIQYKYKNRKARYTFPNELDDVYDKPSRHKHRRKTYTYSITEHNCDNVVRITEYKDGVHKKVVVVKKYKKTYPEEQIEEKDDAADNTPAPKIQINTKTVIGCLSAIAIKILCILGIISVSL